MSDEGQSDDVVYCPYTNAMVPKAATSPEHIIPLALGGADEFTVPVEGTANSTLGSKIDGALANDFLAHMRRRRAGVRGHNRRYPEQTIKNAKLSREGTPVQARFTEVGFKVFDPRAKEYLTAERLKGQTVNITATIPFDLRIRFVAKVALGAGYLAYDRGFVEHVEHQYLRLLMNRNFSELKNDLPPEGVIRVSDEFKSAVSDDETAMRALTQCFARFAVIIEVSKTRITTFVSLFGRFLALVGVPANSEQLPHSGRYDQGHVFWVNRNGVYGRTSLRELRGAYLRKVAPELVPRE